MAQTTNGKSAPPVLTNAEIAALLDETAGLLEAQEANPYRVQAYRNGAQTLRNLARPAADLLESEGVEGLERLPAIGRSLARAIEQIVDTGRLTLLERLRGDVRPERVFTTVPGIGPKLAQRIHDSLDIETLSELHAAAIDGHLSSVPGFGDKRVRAVAESLSGRLRRPPRQPARSAGSAPSDPPPVAELLDVDAEYRRKVAADRLVRIAPRRFNPTGAAWLPILHTRRGNTQYTALYSNTARAHELGTTKDWVVIYRDDSQGNGQWTVITSRFGPLRGKRIVRGREEETRRYYAELAKAHAVEDTETKETEPEA